MRSLDKETTWYYVGYCIPLFLQVTRSEVNWFKKADLEDYFSAVEQIVAEQMGLVE